MLDKSRLTFVLAVAFAATALADSLRLNLSPRAPEIAVSPQDIGRRGVVLPALEYHFDVDARCPPSQQATSLMISIADSRKRVTASALDSALVNGLSITVPAKQIAPVAVADFCDAMDPHTRRSATVVGLLSAQAALACAGGELATTGYTSVALDVRLRCDVAAETSSRTSGKSP